VSFKKVFSKNNDIESKKRITPKEGKKDKKN
jgi:hypothetical protein